VYFDIKHPASGRPTMGDREIKGRRSSTTFSSTGMKIDQMRLSHDSGGRMSQQRTTHDLRGIGRVDVMDMAARTIDQVRLIHCAGDRGQDEQLQWMVPLASDPEFSDICVNTIKRPSYNRHFYAAGATGVAELDSTCILTLYDIARMRSMIDEMESPFLPVVLPGDKAAARNPLYVLRVTPRQWHHLQTYHDGRGKDWQTFVSNARNRGADNPLFSGDEVGMWRGILVIKGLLPIRWNQGATMTVATNAAAYAETTATVPTFDGDASDDSDHGVERALLFGGQAWASIYGQDSRSGMPTRWFEGMEDDDNRYVCSLGGMCGFSKLSFLNKSGVHTDHGVIALDSYAPKAAGGPIEINVA
jgi:N4-gp56 family major capsid protein